MAGKDKKEKKAKVQEEGLQMKHFIGGVIGFPLILFTLLYCVQWVTKPSAVTDGKATVQTMTAEMVEIRDSLKRIADAGTDDSEVFQALKVMSKKADSIIRDSQAAKTEDAKKEILSKGILQSAEWLKMLSEAMTKMQATAEEAAEDIKDYDHVTRLSKDTFDGFVKEKTHAMVEFYAPWCGHCKDLAPKYAAVAAEYKDQVGFAVVDATKEPEIAKDFNIEGYPTLKWFYKGVTFNYDGERSQEKISKFVSMRLKPNFQQMEEIPADLTEALEETGGKFIVLKSAGPEGSAAHQTFAMISEFFRGKELLCLWGVQDTEVDLTLHVHKQAAKTCKEALGDGCKDHAKVVEWIKKEMVAGAGQEKAEL
eukprot:TRINITY_DN31096_c0_g1_i1.p1 TRINITY_DN31096_c0_g1~~TRINITY_DN31096_c0_g1_i1.p1  ORF type:complete len:367 (+),score=105.61 TRINITY_DN31096_c0_g1_i1:51-1151(+)